jgi:hypothetical protein
LILVGIDAGGVDEGSRAVVVGEDDGEALPAKVFSGVDISVDDEGVGEAPSSRCIGRGVSSWFTMTFDEDPPTKVFDGGEVVVDAENVGEGHPTKLFGGGEVDEVTKDGGEARRQR